MADIERLIDTRELRTSLWTETVEEDGSKTSIYYNNRVDSLTLLIVPRNTPKRVHYIDEHVALLYLPDNKEVIGLRVEAFRRSFLPKYAELQKAWSLRDTGVELRDFGDLTIAIRRKEPLVAQEISRITGRLARKKGLTLEPVTA